MTPIDLAAYNTTEEIHTMVKTLAARVLRASVRQARRFAERFDPTTMPGNYSNPDFMYDEINKTVKAIVADGGARARPSYTWGVVQSAHLARTLGVPRVSVIEFGVAGGNGLVALEHAAARAEALLGVEIDVHGFDTGRGLPKPDDYRDLPNIYAESQFVMDEARLRARLDRATLHLGLVAETIPAFVASRPAPIAFISFDLDYYSSTRDALTVLEAGAATRLPRVHCYFDDIMGFSCSEYTGQRLAIEEFNCGRRRQKISPIFGLKYFLPPPYAHQQWSEMFYLAHDFDHPQYGHYDGLVKNGQRVLASLLMGLPMDLDLALLDILVGKLAFV